MTEAAPVVSIVVPTWRRPGALRECLAALAELDYPRDRLDAIVVGDTAVAPEQILGAAGDRLDVRLVRHGPGGPATLRNHGAAAAAGELIAFVDDDCRLAPDWLRRAVDRWRAQPGAAVGGHTVNALAGNRWASASQLIIHAGYRREGGRLNAADFFTTNNLLVPRAGFLELGGFDETFRTSEDRDFSDRWLERGWPMAYVPEAVVYHVHDIGPGGFARRNFWYGRGTARYWRKRSSAGREGLRVDPAHYRWLARASLRRGGPGLALAVLGAHVLYAAGYLVETARLRLEPAAG